MADSRRSEDVYGEKIDRCIYNSVVKLVGGVGVGIVISVLLLKRKPWPLILGGGVGAGMGISDCNHEFRNGSPAPKAFISPRKTLEKLRSLKNEFMTSKLDSHESTEHSLVTNKIDLATQEKTTCCDGKHGKNCLCKNKDNRAKSVKNKPFPCISEGSERRTTEN